MKIKFGAEITKTARDGHIDTGFFGWCDTAQDADHGATAICSLEIDKYKSITYKIVTRQEE